MSAYDRAKDKHLDHTEENASSNCYFCQQNNWVEEPETNKNKEYTEGQLKRLRHLYKTHQLKIKHLDLDAGREAELKKDFNLLDQRLSNHDGKYKDYEREKGQYSEEEITELERKGYENRRKEQKA